MQIPTIPILAAIGEIMMQSRMFLEMLKDFADDLRIFEHIAQSL